MASRYEVEVTLSSAKDLKNINWRYGPIRPYAILWVNPDRKVTTRTCDEGDTEPEWNQKVVVPLDCPVEEATLYVEVVHYATPEEEDTKPLIGSAKLSLRDIVDDEGVGALAPRKLKLKRPSGRPQGKLELEIMVRDQRYRGENPYPPPQVGYSTGESPYYAQNKSAYPYGEQAPVYGEPARYGEPGYYGGQAPAYGEPAPYGNPGYGGQPPVYGEPVPAGQGYEEVHTEEKKSKFGGMGTGLAVGAVAGVAGGLALGYGIHKLTEDDDDEEEEKEEEEREEEEEEEVAEREYEEEEEEEEEAHDDDDE